jgi:hypothetical protein
MRRHDDARRKLCSGASILILSSLALWGQVQPSYAQVLPVRAASGHVAPLPISGGDLIPCPCTGQAGGSLLIHQFLPGPGFDGQDPEPNGITNFNGTFAQVYMGGHAVDSAGRMWDVDVDTRVYRKYSLFPDRREYETSLGGSSPRLRTSSRKAPTGDSSTSSRRS